MITGHVEGRIEVKVYEPRISIFTTEQLKVTNKLKHFTKMFSLDFEGAIPKVGDSILVGENNQFAKVTEISWITGDTIRIYTNHVVEVLEDEETEKSRVKAQEVQERWNEGILRMEEKRRELWEPKVIPVEQPKKKGWFW